MTPGTRAGATGRARSRLVKLALVAIAVVALGWCVHPLDPRAVLVLARNASPSWLALSGVAVVARFLLWGVKWQRMLARRAPVPLSVVLRAILAGSFVNLTTPTFKLAGGFVRAAIISRRCGWPMLDACGHAVADQGTNAIGHLALYGLVSVLAARGLPPGPMRLGLVTSGALVLGVLVAFVVFRGPIWRLALRPAPNRLLARLLRREPSEEAEEPDLARVLRPLLGPSVSRTAWAQDVGLAVTSIASVCISNVLVLRAVGVDAPIPIVASAVLLSYFAGTAAGIGGGLGVTEVALATLYAELGLAAEAAATGVLLHRGMFYAIVLGCGGLALAIESRGQAPRRRPPGLPVGASVSNGDSPRSPRP